MSEWPSTCVWVLDCSGPQCFALLHDRVMMMSGGRCGGANGGCSFRCKAESTLSSSPRHSRCHLTHIFTCDAPKKEEICVNQLFSFRGTCSISIYVCLILRAQKTQVVRFLSVGSVPLGVALIQVVSWIRIACSCFVASNQGFRRTNSNEGILFEDTFDLNLRKVRNGARE